MSEDTTKDMSQQYDTKPTIETVLERINEMQSDMQVRLDRAVDGLRIEMKVGFDRVESVLTAWRSEFLTLRADFRELKHALGEHIPALKS